MRVDYIDAARCGDVLEILARYVTVTTDVTTPGVRRLSSNRSAKHLRESKARKAALLMMMSVTRVALRCMYKG